MALPYDIEYYRRVGEAYLDPDDANLPATGEDIIALVTEVERLNRALKRSNNLVRVLKRKLREEGSGDCDCGVCDTCSSLVEKALANKGLGPDGKPIR
tara:strand:+ start:25 stop:318 length:294 start_codon:yes stop_codon:yes gene_type:complete